MDRGPEVGATLGAQEQRPLRRARQHARPLGRPVGCQAHGFLVSRYILEQRVDAEVETMGRWVEASAQRRRDPESRLGAAAPGSPSTQRRVWTPTWQPLPEPSTRIKLAGALSVARALEAGEAPVRPGLGDGDTAAKHHAPQPRAAPLRGECPRTTGQVPSHGCFGRQGPDDHLWLSSPPAAAGKGILAR